MPALPSPPRVQDVDGAVAWVRECLGHLTLERPGRIAPGGHRGGQSAVDVALAGIDVAVPQPWPWPARPASRRLTSFGAWRKGPAL